MRVIPAHAGISNCSGVVEGSRGKPGMTLRRLIELVEIPARVSTSSTSGARGSTSGARVATSGTGQSQFVGPAEPAR